MSILKEFKEFAMRGNVIDLAVGVVIGGAFGKIVSSLVENIIMPPIGVITGGIDFKDLAFTLVAANAGKPAVVLGYGKFIQSSVDFLIVAAAIFFMVKALNHFMPKKAAAPTGPTQEELLMQIRDLLKETSK